MVATLEWGYVGFDGANGRSDSAAMVVSVFSISVIPINGWTCWCMALVLRSIKTTAGNLMKYC